MINYKNAGVNSKTLLNFRCTCFSHVNLKIYFNYLVRNSLLLLLLKPPRLSATPPKEENEQNPCKSAIAQHPCYPRSIPLCISTFRRAMPHANLCLLSGLVKNLCNWCNLWGKSQIVLSILTSPQPLSEGEGQLHSDGWGMSKICVNPRLRSIGVIRVPFFQGCCISTFRRAMPHANLCRPCRACKKTV